MSQSKGNILIVDDIKENLRILSSILTEQGYQVRPALSGQLALTAVQESPPDLVLLDIMMPGLDGYEVCRRLKANEQTQDIPVIFISALDEVFDKMTAFSIGGVDYITKPFQIEEVLARVYTHLALRNMRQKLKSKNEQLQEQNQELDAFAHTVAHDLKNPLSRIIGSLSLLKETSETELQDEAQEILQISLRAGEKMASIIDELLLLASVRKDKVQIKPLDMAGIVTQVQDRLRHMIQDYQAKITVPNTWPVALGYPPSIEEVWVNYISNGLKYGDPPPHLQLGAAPQNNHMIRFWIEDNGPGLTQEEQATLFTEFTRLSKIRAQGHGLGLSIVKRIVDKLGSTFYFELPAAEISDHPEYQQPDSASL